MNNFIKPFFYMQSMFNKSMYSNIIIFLSWHLYRGRILNQLWLFINNAITYLKLARVKSWVISLYNSSLNVEKTFKSVTNISTAFALSLLQHHQTGQVIYHSFHNKTVKVPETGKTNSRMYELQKNSSSTGQGLQDTFASLFQKISSSSICYHQLLCIQISTFQLPPILQPELYPQSTSYWSKTQILSPAYT